MLIHHPSPNKLLSTNINNPGKTITIRLQHKTYDLAPEKLTGIHLAILKFKPQTVWGQPNCDIKLGEGARDAKITGNHFEGLYSYSAVCGADDSGTGGVDYTEHATGVLVTNNTFVGYARPLFLHSVDNLTIPGNLLRDSLRDAIRLRENDGYVIINSNQFINIGEDSNIYETQDAIDTFWSGSKLIISDNVIRGTKMIGFDIKSVSVDGTKGSRMVSDDTDLENAGEQDVGIFVNDSENVIIKNNLARCHQGGQILVGIPTVIPPGNLSIESTDPSCL